MTERPRVVVVGSLHMDLIARADRLPAHGESVTGGHFTMAPGGKGGNQACQFALAGAQTCLVTRLGDDAFGRQLLAALGEKGVDTSFVAVDGQAATGASAVLAAQGDYASIIAPGACSALDEADLERARTVIEAADALVLQLELPAAISARAAAMAAEAGVAVILNASPAPDSPADIPDSLWTNASVLVVNGVEARRLLGRTPAELREVDAAHVASQLGIETVVVTHGSRGVSACRGDERVRREAFPAHVADSVGAGDAFLGVFATALLQGLPLAAAVERGAAAGALAVARSGVYEALPSRDEVDRFLLAMRSPGRPALLGER